MAQKTLILMAGMPGSGKSTVAQGLGQALGWPVIDKDVVASALLDAGIPEEQMQPAAYEAIYALTHDLLVRQDGSVILDTPAGWPIVVERAQQICEEARARLIPVLCSVDREVRNFRVANRAALPSQPIREGRTPGYARERFVHLPPDRIEIVTESAAQESIDQAVRAVLTRMAETEYPTRHGSNPVPCGV